MAAHRLQIGSIPIAMATGMQADVETKGILDDGSDISVSIQAFPTFDSNGKVSGFIEIVQDITKRKQAEEALRTSENQLSNAMKIAKLGYWEYDVVKDLFTFNDHFYRVFRTTAEKVGGYTMSFARYTQLFLPPDVRDLIGIDIQKVLEIARG